MDPDRTVLIGTVNLRPDLLEPLEHGCRRVPILVAGAGLNDSDLRLHCLEERRAGRRVRPMMADVEDIGIDGPARCNLLLTNRLAVTGQQDAHLPVDQTE